MTTPSARPPAGPPVRGAILAGGGATRFGGRPKGLEHVGGERILDRLAHVLEAALGDLPLLVANVPEAVAWCPGLRVVPDVAPGAGSLGGIYTALQAGPGPVVCVAWDMPFVPAGLIRQLAEEFAGYDAFLPESGGRRGVEPMCAAYGPACAPAIAARIREGDFRAVSFHESVKVGILSLGRVCRFGDPEFLFFNVNTAADLAEADELWRRHGSSR